MGRCKKKRVNYYPFGLQQKRPGIPVNGRSHAYRYNNTELEEGLGLNWYEMPLRSFDPTIARWNRVDPITHHTLSTYNTFGNNPVYYNDPSGGSHREIREGRLVDVREYAKDPNAHAGYWSTEEFKNRDSNNKGQGITNYGTNLIAALKDLGIGYTIQFPQDLQDSREVVKKALNNFKQAKKVSGKFQKAYNALDAFYSLGDGASPTEQTKALSALYKSIGGLLPKNVSVGVFSAYYDTYLAMINHQLGIVVQGMRQYNLNLGSIAALDGSEASVTYPGAFAGGNEVYRYMQQIKAARDGGNHGSLVGVDNKVLNFVYEYKNIIQFTTGQNIPSLYSLDKGTFNLYTRFRGNGSAIDYQTAEYFLSNFDSLERALYGGLKVRN